MAWLRSHLPLIVIIFVGFALRLHGLEATPLRGDEAFSAQYWSDLSLAESLSQIAPIDPHPPLTFALFRFWGLLLGGIESVFSLRYLSALGNMIGIPAMFALGCRFGGGREAGLIAALIWALHPYEIWHSQDYRNYAVWAGVSAVSLWLGLRLIDRRAPVDWLLYAAAAICAALLFYAETLNVLALSGVALLASRRQRQFTSRFLLLQLAVASAAIIAFLLIQARSDFFGTYGGNLEPFAPADYLTRLIPTLTFGDYFVAWLAAFWPVVALVYLVAALAVWRASRRQFARLMLLLWLPLLLLGAVSLSRDIFNPRYVLHTVPALILLLAFASLRAADWLRRRAAINRGVLALCILSLWFAFSAAALDAYYNDPAFRKAPAWDELGRFLSARVNENDLVIQLSVDPAFAYYYRGEAPEMALPAHPAQPADEIIAMLEGLRRRYQSIFVVAREQAGWRNAGVVERWMSENLQQVMRTDAAGLPARQFMEWSTPREFAGDMVQFGDTVALLGYDFFPAPTPTGELLLWLYWQPLSITERSLKSFAHVYGAAKTGAGNALWSQDDQFPQGSRLDSTSWKIDEVFRDVYYLPARDLEEGDYQISVGWYDPVDGGRLRSADGSDSFALENFRFARDKGADE